MPWPLLLVWAFWTAVSIGVSYGIALLTKKDPKEIASKPNDLNMPTNEEGGKLPVLFGSCWIENPVIAYWGDTKAEAIRVRDSGQYYTAGYDYYVGEHDILCQGQADGVKGIRVGDRHIWPNPEDPAIMADDGITSISLNLPDIFGGWDKGGGLVGTVDFQYGQSDQQLNSYLLGIQGPNVSANRGVTAAIRRQVKCGTSPYLTGWKYLLKRTNTLASGQAQWYAAKATIGADINPAHLLRECYTDTEWGLGMDLALFDDADWCDFADKLYAEGFGLSMKWEGRQTLEDFVGDVLRHIEAVIYQDHSTGKMVPKLMRNDYILDELETFDDSDIEAIKEFSRGTIHRVPNVIRLTHWNLVNNKPISVVNHDLSLISKQNNALVVNEVEFYGVTNPELAGRLLMRHIKQVTSFPASVSILAKRTMAHLMPGAVFKLRWPAYGIDAMVLRVLRPNYGTLVDGTVRLDCIQEVATPVMASDPPGTELPDDDSIFILPPPLYEENPPTGWYPPASEPEDVTEALLMESPFWTLIKEFGLSFSLLLEQDAAFLTAAAAAPTGDSFDYELLLRKIVTEDFISDGRGSFTLTDTILTAMPLNAEDIVVSLSVDASPITVGSYAVVGQEVLKVLAASNGSVTLARGCLDTLPAAHSIGERIWLVEAVKYFVESEFSFGNDPSVKFLPRTAMGQLDPDDATIYTADPFDARQVRPYPPGNLKINDLSYPETFMGQPTLTWSHRDRRQQTAYIVEHDEGDIGPEAGVTYTLKIYDEDNNLVRTEEELTGTSYTYTEENERADCGLGEEDPLNTQLRFVLYAVRTGYTGQSEGGRRPLSGILWSGNPATLQENYSDAGAISHWSTPCFNGVYYGDLVHQTFTPKTAHKLSKVRLYIKKADTTAISFMAAQVFATDENGRPTGSALVSLIKYNPYGSETFDWKWEEFRFETAVEVQPNIKYAVKSYLQFASGNPMTLYWARRESDVYAGGQIWHWIWRSYTGPETPIYPGDWEDGAAEGDQFFEEWSDGDISWSALNPEQPIIFRVDSNEYEIAPGTTYKTYAYWDPASPNVFSATDDYDTATAEGCILVCTNNEGVPEPNL